MGILGRINGRGGNLFSTLPPIPGPELPQPMAGPRMMPIPQPAPKQQQQGQGNGLMDIITKLFGGQGGQQGGGLDIGKILMMFGGGG